jgi:hypothetical protein
MSKDRGSHPGYCFRFFSAFFIADILQLPSAKLRQAVASGVFDFGTIQFVVSPVRVVPVIAQQTHLHVPPNRLIAAPQNVRSLAGGHEIDIVVGIDGGCRLCGLCGKFAFVDFGHYSALLMGLKDKLVRGFAMKVSALEDGSLNVLALVYLCMLANPGIKFEEAVDMFEKNEKAIAERFFAETDDDEDESENEE